MLIVSVVAVYANTFRHGFVLDDDVVFVQNRFVQEGIAAIPKIVTHGFLYGYNQKNDQSYRPLVLINFAIEKSIVGNNPEILHRFQAIYYAILCCLLYYLLALLFKGNRPWTAFWISLLFALHPIHTEVVANIKGRDDILHAIFLLWSLIGSIKYVDTNKKSDLLIALITFFLALLCKEMAVTYIVLLPMTVFVFRTIEFKQLLKLTSIFGGVLILYFLLRNAILDTITFEEKMKVINNGLAAASNYKEQLATTILIVGNYIKLLFFPHPLAWDYSYPHFPIVNFSNLKVVLILLGLLTAGIFSLIQLKNKSIPAYGFLFLIVSFSIVSNLFILIGSTMGERFMFFPSIGFCILLVIGIEEGSKRITKKASIIKTAIFLLIGLGYALKTIDRNKDWESNETLFISGAEATPNNTRAISALATVYRERGERSTNQGEQLRNYRLAIQYYQRSIELYRANTDSHYNLGVVYMNMNQNKEAKAAFEQVIALDSTFINALNNLGVIYFRQSNYGEAEKLFLRCIELNQNMANPYANLGAIYHNLGEVGKAEQYYRKALQLNPNDRNTQSNLNKLLN